MYILGTIHLRRWQIFTIFDPYPPTIGIPAKCFLWRGFLILMYCDLWTIGTWGHPSPLRQADVLNGWFLYFWDIFFSIDMSLFVRVYHTNFPKKQTCIALGKSTIVLKYERHQTITVRFFYLCSIKNFLGQWISINFL